MIILKCSDSIDNQVASLISLFTSSLSKGICFEITAISESAVSLFVINSTVSDKNRIVLCLIKYSRNYGNSESLPEFVNLLG